jgi:hypothetical protein
MVDNVIFAFVEQLEAHHCTRVAEIHHTILLPGTVPELAQEASGGKLSPYFSLDIEGDLSMDLEFFVQRPIPIPQSRLPACVSPNLC